MCLAAIGVVYGDIGTSPLYAIREVFGGPHRIEVSEGNVLGILSLVFWILIITISIKYILFVLRADNRGEGGILSLMALANPRKHEKFLLLAVGIFGATLLYGDGVITPAISVLGAMEGLELVTPLFKDFVLPVTILILIGLFWFQKHGTARIGLVFGPIMVLYFVVIGGLGLGGIIMNPIVLQALNPIYALDFFLHHQHEAYFAMGTLILVVTGGEALYADMGHFGRLPIRRAWIAVVLPSLVLNYFGQGALLLQSPEAAKHPFYMLAPQWLLIPLVILATSAAVIASQAVITGVYSLTHQAIQLGLWPRMQIVHTSSREIGQIYMPQVNWALLIGCVWLVWSFKNSSGLAAAYGIAVSGTMICTTLLLYVVAKNVWKWSWAKTISILTVFLIIDFAFFSASIIKTADGGYVPLLIAAVFYVMMLTWRKGRQILSERLKNSVVSLDKFLEQMRSHHLARVPGVAIYMVNDPETTPPSMVHNVKHNKVLHEKVIILSISTKQVPVVAEGERMKFEKVEGCIFRAVAKYGFMESPDIVDIVGRMKQQGLDVDLAKITFFLGRETLIASDRPGMAMWREHLFSFMARNAQRATAYFNIPADQVIEVGIQVEL